jgi:hypothetical protein
MYCNIDEAFSGNSTYIKNILDNELNNEKLLDRYKNFDTYFEKPKIIEHFNESSRPRLECNTIVEHVIRCSECRKMIIKNYCMKLLNGNLNGIGNRNIITILLVIILIVIGLKILWKL